MIWIPLTREFFCQFEFIDQSLIYKFCTFFSFWINCSSNRILKWQKKTLERHKYMKVTSFPPRFCTFWLIEILGSTLVGLMQSSRKMIKSLKAIQMKFCLQSIQHHLHFEVDYCMQQENLAWMPVHINEGSQIKC